MRWFEVVTAEFWSCPFNCVCACECVFQRTQIRNRKRSLVAEGGCFHTHYTCCYHNTTVNATVKLQLAEPKTSPDFCIQQSTLWWTIILIEIALLVTLLAWIMCPNSEPSKFRLHLVQENFELYTNIPETQANTMVLSYSGHEQSHNLLN